MRSRSLVPAGVIAALLSAAAVPILAGEPLVSGERTTVELTIVGAPDLNPNGEGRASPVVVRVFELTAATAFDAADYNALFEHPGADLTREVVAQEEFVLRPGDIQEHDRDLPPQVQSVGVAAAFRDLDHARWHLAVPVTVGRRNFVLIDLERDSIRVVPVDQRHP